MSDLVFKVRYRCQNCMFQFDESYSKNVFVKTNEQYSNAAYKIDYNNPDTDKDNSEYIVCLNCNNYVNSIEQRLPIQ